MQATDALARLGGVAELSTLLGLTSRARLPTAVAAGAIRRPRHNVYVLPGADQTLVAARRLGGVASHLSAAQLHGWELAVTPTSPWVTVPRNRTVTERRGAHVFWGDLADEPGPATSQVRTVVACGRRLRFGPALAVADSALRHADVDRDQLRLAAAAVRGKGAAQARRVADEADPRAANPFESVLRGLARDAALDVEPQFPILLADRVIHPDLVDLRRRLVLEADSWEFHTGRDAHERDCRRYTLLVLDGWTVLRFTWRQVMYEPDWVFDRLLAAGQPHRRAIAT